MKPTNKQIKIVEDANRFIKKFRLYFYNDHSKTFSTNEKMIYSESMILFEISKSFCVEPEKLHHSYMNDLIKQIKFTLINKIM